MVYSIKTRISLSFRRAFLSMDNIVTGGAGRVKKAEAGREAAFHLYRLQGDSDAATVTHSHCQSYMLQKGMVSIE